MDAAELYGVQAELLAHISNIFEIWLGFTFAALVAFHFAANQLSKRMLRVTQTLYTLASILFVGRYFGIGAATNRISDQLEVLGLEPLVPTGLGFFIFLLMTLLYLAGHHHNSRICKHSFQAR